MELRKEFQEAEGIRQERREGNREGSSSSSHHEEEKPTSLFVEEDLVEDYIRSTGITMRPERKRELIRINSTSNWLIFDRGSLKEVRTRVENGLVYSYEINSPQLRRIIEFLAKEAGLARIEENFKFSFDEETERDSGGNPVLRGYLK